MIVYWYLLNGITFIFIRTLQTYRH